MLYLRLEHCRAIVWRLIFIVDGQMLETSLKSTGSHDDFEATKRSFKQNGIVVVDYSIKSQGVKREVDSDQGQWRSLGKLGCQATASTFANTHRSSIEVRLLSHD